MDGQSREALDEVREAVRRLCTSFPDRYWRWRDRDGLYPTDFVRASSDACFTTRGPLALPATRRCTSWERFFGMAAMARTPRPFELSRSASISDLMLLPARATPKDQVKKRTDGLSIFIDRGETKVNGLSAAQSAGQ
jgi:hypothetical protein